MDRKDIAKIFKEKGIRSTPQRIEVYKFLLENRIHASVDQIYNALIDENPNLSRTTIYNCLNTLLEAGLIIDVRIINNELRYDAYPHFHGHFVCERCNKIFDFDTEEINARELEGARIKQKDVYFTGICKECLKDVAEG